MLGTWYAGFMHFCFKHDLEREIEDLLRFEISYAKFAYIWAFSYFYITGVGLLIGVYEVLIFNNKDTDCF